MWHDLPRTVVLAGLFSGLLSAQSAAPKPVDPGRAEGSITPEPKPKAPSKSAKGKARQPSGLDKHASVKPEVAAKSKIRSRELKAEKAKSAMKGPVVGINTGSREDLKKLPGMTDAYADAIIAKRPYKTRTELITRDVIPAGLYQSLRRQLATK